MPGRRLISAIPAGFIALAVIGTPLLGLAEPVSGEEVAAVFPPGWDEADILLASAAAETSVVRFGALANIGIIRIADPDALAALRDQGAWLLLHPQALGGCLIGPERTVMPAPDTNWSST